MIDTQNITLEGAFHSSKSFKTISHSDNIHKLLEIEDIQNWMMTRHVSLRNEYKDEQNHPESCMLVALEIAKILLKQGKTPKMYIFRAEGNGKSLIPIQYDGRISWGLHVVCECDGFLFDPILPRPVTIDEYGKKVFGKSIEAHEIKSTKWIGNMLHPVKLM